MCHCNLLISMNFETEGHTRLWSMKNFLMLIVPSCVVFLALSLQGAKGPFWLGNLFEAEYSYLMNSLAVSQGLQVLHADHPGFTLQLLGGIMLHVIHLVAGKEDLAGDVLVRPEFYLSSLYGILLLFLFLSLTIAGILISRWSGDYIAAILLQTAIPLSYSARHFALPRMKPEHLLLILAVWMSIIVLYHYRQVQQHGKKEPVWQYGLITGLGIGLKITFVPLVTLPLVLLKGIKKQTWIYWNLVICIFCCNC